MLGINRVSFPLLHWVLKYVDIMNILSFVQIIREQRIEA